MGPRKKYPHKGGEAYGNQVEVAQSTEAWNVYTLEDGTVLRIKVVLLDVVRMEDHDDKGNPIYRFSAQQIVSVTAPDELMKKKAN